MPSERFPPSSRADRPISRFLAGKLRPSQVLAAPTTAEAEAGGIPAILDFVDLESCSFALKSRIDVDQPLFQPYPHRIIFRDYKAYEAMEQRIFFRNNSSVGRRIKVFLPASPYFEVTCLKASGHGVPLRDSKVASGMSVCCSIQFNPREVKEYSCELLVWTEREKYIIPITARGERPLLSMPDQIDFDVVAVKYAVSKAVILKNVGACQTDFKVYCSNPVFTVTPEQGSLGPHATCSIQAGFRPLQTNQIYQADLKVEYTGGETVYVGLSGRGANVDVQISEDLLAMDKTFITLQSQRTVKIRNNSDIPVRFVWKNFAGVQQEEVERGRLRSELSQAKQEIELSAEELHSWGKSGSSVVDYKSSVESAIPEGTLAYLEGALQDGSMLYQHDNFYINPTLGEIWPGNSAAVTITFRPTLSVYYRSEAYLDVVGKEDRMCLKLQGYGLGPKAKLSYDVLDVGDVYIGLQQQYDVYLTNVGSIKCHWQLRRPEAPHSSMYGFSADQGCLDVGDTCTVSVRLMSEVLGEFCDCLSFRLAGSTQMLPLQVKGHVMGPSFSFDVETLNFGLVAYDFFHTRTFQLSNNCSIGFGFEFQVPQDNGYSRRDFDVKPKSGWLGPLESNKVTVRFTPSTIKVYEDYILSMNVEKVGQGLGVIPIEAECQVPKVRLAFADLDFGEMFLRFPYEQEFFLINEHPELHAKYEILSQEPDSLELATFEGLPPSGAIPPSSEQNVGIRMISHKLGSFRLSVQVSIQGSLDTPLQVNLCAVSRGPDVDLSLKDLQFGPTQCLQDVVRKIKMTNRSTIPASLKMYLGAAQSSFRIEMREAVLQPWESSDLNVHAYLDDTSVHRDRLYILVTEGSTIMVPLSAIGSGTTIFCSESLDVIDLGASFTSRVCDRKLTLENRGKRRQKLRWMNETFGQAAISGSASREDDFRKLAGRAHRPSMLQYSDHGPHFSVSPDTIELRPWTAMTCTFRGQSTTPGVVTEALVCEGLLSGEQHFKPIFKSILTANFVDPFLEMSQSCLTYVYTWSKDNAPTPQTTSVTLANRSQLPLSFTLRTQPPFSLDTCDHGLQPGESAEVKVTFNPAYREDRVSHQVEDVIVIAYNNHPHRDEIVLVGTVHFANLEFAYRSINFGCVLNDTTRTMLLRVTNPSPIDAWFSWSFIEDEEAKRTTAKRPYIPVNQVFDVLPIRSRLGPGESEDVEIVYYAHANRKCKGVANCDVEGGPVYELLLSGEASTVSYQLDRTFLDFGRILHTKTDEKAFTISNPSKVTFSFRVCVVDGIHASAFSVLPSSGKVFGGDRQKVQVRFYPGLPEAFRERILVEIAHFDPIEIPLHGEGTYVSVAVCLPRDMSRGLYYWRKQLTGGSAGKEASKEMSWDQLLLAARRRLSQTELSAFSPQTSPAGSRQQDGGSARSSSQSSIRTESITQSAGHGLRRLPSAISIVDGDRELENWDQSEAASTTSGLRLSRSAANVDGSLHRGLSSTSGTSVSQMKQFIPGAAPRHITSFDVEMEANRLLYVEYLKDAQAHSTIRATGSEPPSAAASPTAGGTTGHFVSAAGDTDADIEALKLPPAQGTASRKLMADAGDEKNQRSQALRGDIRVLLPPFIMACHIVDFGQVILGTSRPTTFKVINPSQFGPVSWAFRKNLLHDTGFSIQPDKVARLPEGARAEFEVKLNTKGLATGPRRVELPLEVQNGPPTVIILQADVCVPEVSLSTDMLDFGSVYTGQGKTMAVQISNLSSINAEWEIRLPSAGSKADPRFVLWPTSGSLAPQHKVNILADFMPLEAKASLLKLALRVQLSNAVQPLTLIGAGKEAQLKFEPGKLEFPPTLPRVASSLEVVMQNLANQTIEVYSLDYDAQYRQEQKMLALPTIYQGQTSIKLPIRKPGESLPDFIIEEYQRTKSQGPSIEDESTLQPHIPNLLRSRTSRDNGGAQDLVVIGPPAFALSGVVANLSRRLSLPCIDFDSLIIHLAYFRSPLGAEVRRAINRPTRAEAVLIEKELAQIRDKLTAARDAAEAVSKATKSSRQKNRAPTEPSHEQQEVQRLELQLQSASGNSKVTKALLAKMLSWRLQEPDAGRGVILEHASTKFVDTYTVLQASGDSCQRLLMIYIETSEESYITYLRDQKQQSESRSAAVETSSLDRASELPLSPKPTEASSFTQLVSPDSMELTKDAGGQLAAYLQAIEQLRSTPSFLFDLDEGQKAKSDSHFSAVPIDITFEPDLDKIIAPLLQARDSEALIIPEPMEYQIISRAGDRVLATTPKGRGRPPKMFSISQQKDDAIQPSQRWLLQAGSRVAFTVSFCASEVCKHSIILSFGVVGSPAIFTLPCRAMAEVPSLCVDPQMVFPKSIKCRPTPGMPVSKVFVQSEAVYDFGPLLLWKDIASKEAARDTFEYKTIFRSNGEKLKFRNTGLFPLKATLAFAVGRGNIFSVEPDTISLAVGGCTDVRLWSFPSSTSTFTSTLTVSVENNPNPYTFKLAAQGARAALSLKGRWIEQAAAQRALAESLPDDPIVEDKGKKGGTSRKPVPAAIPISGPKAAALAKAVELERSPTIEFERVLVGVKKTQDFQIINTSPISVVWRLRSEEILESSLDYKANPAAGQLPAYGEATVTVSFCATNESACEGKLDLEYADSESGLEPVSTRSTHMCIRTIGEAYRIHFVPFEKTILNFGNLRAGDPKTEILTLANTGKHTYAYAFTMRKKWARQSLTIDEPAGSVEPGASVKLQLTFCCLQAFSAKQSKALRCTISVPRTCEVIKEVDFTISGQSVYPAVTLRPRPGVSFGTLKHDAPTEMRSFDIRNDGLYPFTFYISGRDLPAEGEAILAAAAISGLAPVMPAISVKSSTAGKATRGTVAPAIMVAPPPKVIESFTFSSVTGSLEAGQSVTILLTFTPSGKAAVYEETVYIWVSRADPAQPKVPYKLRAETCYPTIACADWYDIFEEICVFETSSAGPLSYVSWNGAERAGEGPAFIIDAKTLHFGVVLCEEGANSVQCRVKVTNTSRVEATVDLDVFYATTSGSPRKALAAEGKLGGREKGGKKQGADAATSASAATSKAEDTLPFPFSVTPATLQISARKHEYVTVTFTARQLMEYRAQLTAKVSGNGLPVAGTAVTFTLVGIGTLPRIKVACPPDCTTLGTLTVDLGVVAVGESCTHSLKLLNSGSIPAKVQVEPQNISQELLLGEADRQMTLSPSCSQDLQLMWSPCQARRYSESFNLRVLHNPFDCTQVTVLGIAVQKDLRLHGLDSCKGIDIISIPEIVLVDPGRAAAESQLTFTLSNNSATPARFNLPVHPPPSLSFVPARGHVAAGGSKSITVRFRAQVPDSIKDLHITLSAQRIQYVAAAPADTELPWDDAQVIVRPGTAEEIARLTNSKKVTKGKKDDGPADLDAMRLGEVEATGVQAVILTRPEPVHEVLGSLSDCPIKLNAAADYLQYTADLHELAFESTALFSASTAQINITNLSNIALPLKLLFQSLSGADDPYNTHNPFSAQPCEGTVLAKARQSIAIHFLPQEVGKFHFLLQVVSPLRSEQPLAIDIRGSAFRPLAHFELEDEGAAEYLATRPQDALHNEHGQLGRIEAPIVRLLRAKTLGVDTRVSKRFSVLNPSSDSLEFKWESRGIPCPAWRCATPTGSIAAGSKGEMIFDFSPSTAALPSQESFWTFRSGHHVHEELFVLSGSVSDPRVSLDRAHLRFKPTVVGQMAVQTFYLRNEESIPFHFAFDTSSIAQDSIRPLSAETKQPVLSIHPATGHAPAEGQVQINAFLRPASEKAYNFNLLCAVGRKPTKLRLNLKGEGYIPCAKAVWSNYPSTLKRSPACSAETLQDQSAIELQPVPALNVLDFGQLTVRVQASRLLTLTNKGRIGCTYSIEHRMTSSCVSVVDGKESGVLGPEEEVQVRILVAPMSDVDLAGSVLKIIMEGIHMFNVQLLGQARRPAISVTPKHYDFGPCFIAPTGALISPECATLFIKNEDSSHAYDVRCATTSFDALRLHFDPILLAAQESTECSLYFLPRKARVYDMLLTFVVDETHYISIRVRGRGIEPRVALARPSMSHIAFGQVLPQQSITKKVFLRNDSEKALTVSLLDHESHLLDLSSNCSVSIEPNPGELSLKARSMIAIQATFAPQKRTPAFSEDVLLSFLGQKQKLLTITGQCLADEVMLETECLNCGSVCLGGYKVARVRLINIGDLPVSFRWEEKDFGPSLAITPMAGDIQASSDLVFEVRFAPSTLSADIRLNAIRLMIHSHEEPLTMSVIGSCVPVPKQSIVRLSFYSRVRSSEVKFIQVSNPTGTAWQIQPVLTGDSWTVPKNLSMPARSVAELQVVYTPIQMTSAALTDKDPAPLVGSLFLPLPDGTAMLYELEGTVAAPAPILVKAEIAAKTAATVFLPVQNWLSVQQEFAVKISAREPAPLVVFSGPERIVTPPLARYDYALRVRAFLQEPCSVGVTCTNTMTGEFILFDVQIQVKQPELLDTIVLQAPVHQVARSMLAVENPLPGDVKLTWPEPFWRCTCPNVRVSRANSGTTTSKALFDVEYRPLVKTPEVAIQAELILMCKELGIFRYGLELRAIPVDAQSLQTFQSPLGSTQTETISFVAHNLAPARFEVRIDSPGIFSTVPYLEVQACGWEGHEVKFPVTFEPEALGQAVAQLRIAGGQYGDFSWGLRGIATQPLPQGPFTFTTGEIKELVFRNVLQEQTEYCYAVEHPGFLLAKASEMVPARSLKTFQVAYDRAGTGADSKKSAQSSSEPLGGKDFEGEVLRARLHVTAKGRPDLSPWIYYLEGR